MLGRCFNLYKLFSKFVGRSTAVHKVQLSFKVTLTCIQHAFWTRTVSGKKRCDSYVSAAAALSRGFLFVRRHLVCIPDASGTRFPDACESYL